MPVWAAGFPGNRRPIRRAARLDGFFPANLEHPDQLAEVVTTILDLRQGATWWLPELPPGVRLDTVRGVLRDGPVTPDRAG